MSENTSTIIYTFTDEAPALATYSFLPIIEAFAGVAGVHVETRDISLAGRIIATFPERLTDEQRIGDALAELGELALTPEANIIKLPNISASVPQMKAAIAELQAKGYDIPSYPDEPSTPEEVEVRARYGTVMGSAVNPVLRQGNSDRRAPKAVKDYAKAHPHSMGAWSPDSKTHVATMGDHDFCSNEQSLTVAADGAVRIEHVAADGSTTVLKDSVPVLAGEVIDSTAMDVAALRSFLAEQIRDAKEQGVLFSIHLKATMMKVSDPIIFGHAVEVFFADVFAKHGAAIAAAGGDPRNGWAGVLSAIETMPADQRAAIEADIAAAYENGPDLAMVDSDKGITNLHVPSDVIVDASMPAMIRTSGQMWNAAGEQQDTKAVIPDSSYAGCVPDRHRGLHRQRCVRPVDDGQRPERRADGPEGRGVRQPRQDLRGAGRGHDPRRRRRLGRAVDGADRPDRRHLPDVPGEGRADPRLGAPRGRPGAGDRGSGGVLARLDSCPRRAVDRQGQPVPGRPRPRRSRDRDPGSGHRHPVLDRPCP